MKPTNRFKLITGLLLIMISLNTFAFHPIPEGTDSNKSSDRCSVVLSNKDSGTAEREFCSGTWTNSGELVTAAHCLSLFRGNKVYLRDQEGNFKSLHFSKENIAISSSPFILNNNRNALENKGMVRSNLEDNHRLAARDYVILATDRTSTYTSCPARPTFDVCKSLKEERLKVDFHKNLKLFVYASEKYRERGNLKQELILPTKELYAFGLFAPTSNNPIDLDPQRTPFFNSVGFINSENKLHRIQIQVGDSGSGLRWNHQGQEYLVGVQSLKRGSNAVFASLCDDVLPAENGAKVNSPSQNRKVALDSFGAPLKDTKQNCRGNCHPEQDRVFQPDEEKDSSSPTGPDFVPQKGGEQ